MNPTIELLRSHRSIRKFKQQVLDEQTVRTLVSCGQSAATSSNVQAVSVIWVRDSSKRAAIAELAGGQAYVSTAGAFLVFCADLHRPQTACELAGGEYAEGMTEQFIIASIDVGLAAQNVVVAAESLGLGICYIGGIRNNPAKLTALLELPEQVYPVFGLCLGYPDQDPEIKPRLSTDTVLMHDRYSSADLAQQIETYDSRLQAYYRTRTGGRKDSTWSQEMGNLVGKESRPHMLAYLQEQGFLKK